MEESKARDFFVHGGSILVCSPSVETALKLAPSCEPPLGEPTHMETSPTTLRIQMIQAKCTGIAIYAIHV
jgi:hypothetical protein